MHMLGLVFMVAAWGVQAAPVSDPPQSSHLLQLELVTLGQNPTTVTAVELSAASGTEAAFVLSGEQAQSVRANGARGVFKVPLDTAARVEMVIDSPAALKPSLRLDDTAVAQIRRTQLVWSLTPGRQVRQFQLNGVRYQAIMNYVPAGRQGS